MRTWVKVVAWFAWDTSVIIVVWYSVPFETFVLLVAIGLALDSRAKDLARRYNK